MESEFSQLAVILLVYVCLQLRRLINLQRKENFVLVLKEFVALLEDKACMNKTFGEAIQDPV